MVNHVCTSMNMDTTKLKGGSNERPCQFVKSHWKVRCHSQNSEKQRGTVSEAGQQSWRWSFLSPRAEFRAQSVHSHMPSQKGEKEQAMAAVSRIYRYQGSLVLHSRTALAMSFNRPTSWDI